MERRIGSSRPPHLWRDSCGTAVTEFALAMPIILLLLAGGYEFGRGIWHYHLVVKGVRDATRYLARTPNPLDAAAQDRARQLVRTANLDPSAVPLLSEWQADPSRLQVSFNVKNFDNSAGIFRGPDGGTADVEVVQSTATVQYPGIGLLGFVGLPAGITFVIRHEERHIGQ